MCCKTRVHRATLEMLPLLVNAGFARQGEATYWSRDITPEMTSVRAAYDRTFGGIVLSLYPSVSTYAQHTSKRLAASLMFQVAALLAEKCGGIVTQESNVPGCLTDERPSTAVVANYPEEPLLFQNLCLGWRTVLLPAEGC